MIRPRVTLDDLRFVPVPGWPSYEANRVAQIRSQPRRTPAGRRGGKVAVCDIPGFEGRYRASALLKQRRNPRTGRNQVMLYRNGRRRAVSVHQVIARTFHGECPPGMEVCHIDEDKSNNWAYNLKYDTPENNRFAYLTSGRPIGRPALSHAE